MEERGGGGDGGDGGGAGGGDGGGVIFSIRCSRFSTKSSLAATRARGPPWRRVAVGSTRWEEEGFFAGCAAQ